MQEKVSEAAPRLAVPPTGLCEITTLFESAGMWLRQERAEALLASLIALGGHRAAASERAGMVAGRKSEGTSVLR